MVLKAPDAEVLDVEVVFEKVDVTEAVIVEVVVVEMVVEKVVVVEVVTVEVVVVVGDVKKSIRFSGFQWRSFVVVVTVVCFIGLTSTSGMYSRVDISSRVVVLVVDMVVVVVEVVVVAVVVLVSVDWNVLRPYVFLDVLVVNVDPNLRGW